MPCLSSAAASGWAGWALAHPEFGSSVNPITTRGGGKNMPTTLLLAHLDLKTQRHLCYTVIRNAHLFSGADWDRVIQGLPVAVNEKCVWNFKDNDSTLKINWSICDFRPSIRQCKCCTCQHAVGIRLLVNCAILGLLEAFRLHKSTLFWFWYLRSKTFDITL